MGQAGRALRRGRGFRPAGEGLETRALLSDGVIDPGFGTGGKVLAAFPLSAGGVDFATSVAVQADGKTVVAGYVQKSGSDYDFGVARFNTDGSLDGTFGTGGLATIAFDVGGNKGDYATDVAIAPDGKIVVGGYAQIDYTGATDFAVARLTSTGQLDTTFAGSGKARTNFQLNGGTLNNARSLVVQPDGKVILAGESQRGSLGDYDFTVARFTADGILDDGFGTGGKAVIAFNRGGTNYDSARSVALQSDGKIVVGGYAQGTGSDADFAAARLNADGTPDGTFGNGGKATVGFNLGAGNFDAANSVAIAPDGKIVLAGRVQLNSAGNYDFGVARLNANGTLDGSFAGGQVVVPFDLGGNGGDNGRAVVVQPDGKVVVAGEVERDTTGNNDFGLIRLNADGTIDGTFGSGGKQILGFDLGGDRGDYPTGLAITPDNKFVVAGHAATASGMDFAIARLDGFTYTPPASPAPTPPAPSGPAPSTPTPTTPLRVVGLGRVKKRGATRAITVSYDASGDPSRAGNLAAYRLRTAGRDKKFGTRDDKVIKLKTASYSAAGRAVTLTLKQPYSAADKLQLVVSAAGINAATVGSATGPDYTGIVPKR